MKSKYRSLVSSIKNTNLVWRYGYNLQPTVDYTAAKWSKADEVERSIVERLNRDGIVVTSVGELLGKSAAFEELEANVDEILDERKDEIEKLQAHANDAQAIGEKTFNLELLGSELVFDPESIFARFALQPTLLNIANAYFKMFAKLRYYNVWKTFASQSEARESQLWHFDREDRYILKVFLYLDDVDEGTGPFTYAPGTHKKGKLNNIKPEFFIEGGVRRTTDEQMDAAFPKENWVRGTGKKGTLIFADTRGFHKGGEARTKDRLMYTCMYTSTASQSKKLLKFPSDLKTGNLSPAQIKALYF